MEKVGNAVLGQWGCCQVLRRHHFHQTSCPLAQGQNGAPPGWGCCLLHGSGLWKGGCACHNQQKRARNPSSSVDAGGAEEEAIPHVTQQEMKSAGKGPRHCSQGGWRGSSDRPASSRHRPQAVPGHGAGFLLLSFPQELWDTCPVSWHPVCCGDTARLQSSSYWGTSNALGEASVCLQALCVCSLGQQLPARTLVLAFMSFIRSVSFQRVVRPQ